MKYFLSVLGLVMLIEGIPYFCFPDKVKFIAEKIPEIKNLSLRMFGLVLIILGLLVLYFTKM